MASCETHGNKLHGYIEAKLTYISSPVAGKLLSLYVDRGEQVSAGQKLYNLELLPESAELRVQMNQLKAAEANLANLLKGKRPSELEAIQAEIEGAKVRIQYFKKEVKRRQSLVQKSAIEKEALDRSIQNLDDNIAQLRNLEAQLETAKLAAREDEIVAARRQVDAAKAQVEKSKWAVEEKTINSPDNAEVFDTYFLVGENVPANQPILSLLVPKEIKVVFYLPEPMLAGVKLNQKIMLSCDNCKKKISARIRFISPMAEYTPPVIYSQSARSKLVYRVEGAIEKKDLEFVKPGQPVDIILKEANN